jgi:hypothetical protein
MRKVLMLVGFSCIFFAGAAFAAQPLSSLPNWKVTSGDIGSWFALFLDSRYINEANFGNISNPEGGVKFELFLLDKVTDSITITKVQYTNTTKKETHVINAQPFCFPDGTCTTEYSMWMGNKVNIVGNWILSVVTANNGIFSYSFSITDAMLNTKSKPPKPTINVQKILNDQSILTGYTATATSSRFKNMIIRLAVTADNGNDFIYRSAYQAPAGTSAQFQISKCITSSFGNDCDLTNNTARLEVKNYPVTSNSTPWFWYSNDAATGNSTKKPYPGRTMLYFKFPK